MEYVYLIGLVIAIVVWIVKGIARFFKWVASSFSGASSAPATPAPMPPRAAAPPAPAPMPPRRPEVTGPPPTRVPSPATLPEQEARRRASESAPLNSIAEPPPLPTPPAVGPLFSSTDDLVRAFILSEVLGPPLSRRRTPPE